MQALGSNPRMLLTQQALAAKIAAGGGPKVDRARKALTYFGGPIIQSPEVVPVFWTAATQFQSQIKTFYSAVTTSTFMSFFTQYNTTTPKQTFVAGKLGPSFTDTDTQTSVLDADIQTELLRLFNAGSIPGPTNNILYAVHFPPGVTINLQGSLSCQVFCAYHSTFQVQTAAGAIQDVFYSVLPDQGGGCAGGCGANASEVNNLTSVASHEFSEALTDAAVGIATVFGPPLGWDDQANGEEIGDLCNAQQGSVVIGGQTFVVQKEWSNNANTRAGACVTP
jgi:hypothetical protein